MKNDGGPAFPSGQKYSITDVAGNKHFYERGPFHKGASLRDLFAAKALQGLLSDISENVPVLDQANPLPEQLKWAAYKAESAYRLADAMIEQRLK